MSKLYKVIMSVIIFFSLFNGFGWGDQNDVYAENNKSIGILSTTVYPDLSVIKYGEDVNINYSFSDRPHPVSMSIYRDGNLLPDTIYKSSSWGGKITYKPQNEGEYRFVVKPTDASSYTEECSVTVYKDRIIFLHGTMGSELFSGEEKIWMPRFNPGALVDIAKLSMNSSGESNMNIKVGHSLDEYYSSIISFFNKEGFKVIDSAYDWRMSSSVSAQKLKETIIKERAQSPYSNFYVIAHSMGGIVATKFIEQGNGHLIKKLVTLATPFLGAPQAAYMFETGNVTGDNTIDFYIHNSIKDIEKNIPSLYELLPSRKYFTYQTNGYIQLKLLPDPNQKRTQVVKQYDFDETVKFLKNNQWWSNNNLMDQAIDFNTTLDVTNTLKKVDSYYFVGDQKKTAGKITYRIYSSYNPLILFDDISNIQGDSVVPVSSATAGFTLDNARTYFVKSSHLGIVKNEDVQKQILNILKGKPNDLVSDNIRKNTVQSKTLKIKAECPVELHVYDSYGNHTGLAPGQSFDSNIPDANYFSDGETKIVLLNADKNYNALVKGTGYGDLTLSIIWADENDIENKTLRFDNIAVTPSSIFTANVQQNGQVVLKIDENGDGTYEQSITPSVELDLEGTQDETIPTISSHIDGVRGTNEWYGKGVYYNLTGEDIGSGVYKTFYNLNNSEEKEYVNPIHLPNTGIYNFKSYVRDKNRNDSEALTETVKVDTTNPTIPVMTVNPTEWTNQFVTISLAGGTDADSGFQKYQYKINQDGEWKDYKDPFVIDTEGLYNVYARSVDNVFNLSGEVTGVAKVDKTNPLQPVMTVEPMKWTNQFVTVTLTGGSDTDKGFPNSEFQKYQYKIGKEGAWKDYTIPIIIDTVGLSTVFARAVDHANNLSEEVTGDAKIDKTPPTMPMGIATVLARSNKVKISWLPSNDNVGVIGYDLYQDSNLVGNTTDTEFTFEKLISNKVYTFKVVARDEAGNSSPDGVHVVRTLIGLATGTNYTLEVKENGSVWAWGSNSSGQLGDGTLQSSKSTAVTVVGLSNVISVAAGAEHSLGLKSDGTVWSWGYNRYGQLGNGNSGNFSESVVPVQVKSLTGIIAIAAYNNSSYALKNDGTVWSWGYNYNGQLGDGTSTERITPVQVVGVSGAITLAAGNNYAYALKTDGTVWGWGKGYAVSGVAGDLTKAILLPGVTNITSLVADGSWYGLMLKTDGSVGVWNGSSLTTVNGLSNIQAIAGGNSNNYAIASDGGIWNWTTGTPVKVGGISDVSAVAVGGNYVVATKTDGSVWAWGSVNTAGQLGDGTTVAHTVPALVKENTAPQVTLTYPLGTKEAPETSNVSQPVIRWSQSDAALTKFAAYQVQMLDANGAVVVDSGEMKQQWMIDGVNTWTVNKTLPVGQAFQVRVKVYDEQLWSEWSAMGWLKVKDSAELKQSTLSTSASHTLQLKADGSVRAWGSNSSGQLGDGTLQSSKSTAVTVVGLSNVISVAAGAEHSLGLKSDGTVWSWGYNRYGQLGNGNSGNFSESVVPVQVKSLTGIIAIAAYNNSSYALKNDGTVWSWGYNYNGQLGDGTSTERITPVQVVGVSGAIALAAGSNYAYALKTDGTVWGWGKGYAVSGVAGDLTKAILLPGVTNIKSLAAGGSSYGLMLKTDGSVGVWNGSSLTTVSGLSNIQAIAGGNSNNYAIASDGGIWNWTTGTPVKVGGISDVSAVAVGGNYVVATKTDGSVWAWGSVNTAGQLGDGTTVAHTVPALVKENTAPQVTLTYPLGTKEAPEASNVSQPVIRWSQSDAALTKFAAYQVQMLDANGAVVVDSGEMKQQWMIDGVNTWTVNKALPVGQAFQVRVKVYDEQLWSEWSAMGWLKVKDSAELKQSTLSASASHTLQLKADGSVWAWGSNSSGQLGDGTLQTSKSTAVTVVGLSNVISVAAGAEHSLGLKSDGTVWSWGYNRYGQLGNGNSGNFSESVVPVQVKSLTGIIAIAAYKNSSYALKNDGTVWSWGYNYNGQLGDGTSTERITPVQVVGVSGAIALAAGSDYAYALKTDGTVWGWGKGYAVSGVAGDLTKAILLPGVTNIKSLAAGGSSYGLMLKTDGSVGVWNGSSLTTVSGLSNIQAIAGGNSNNYAIASDGGIWNWTTGTPVKVGGISDVSAVAVGGNYVVATKTDGSVWAWGSVNTAGQLGDGTTVAHTVPALVKENTAPQVTLTYPLGTKEAPEASNVSQPVIRWSQSDVALTNFAAYQVQVLDASGAVVVDSGEVKQQWMIDGVNTWTVNKALPVGQAFQVRVKVYDEQLWSEWSAMGWLKVKDSAELKQSTLSTSASHTLQLKADGSVRAWGSNSSGQLGDGTRQNSKTTAVSVLGLSNVISVAAGAEHSLGLKSDGTVWSWGYNRYGQLGNGNSGNNSDSVVPVQVKTLTGIIAIAAIGNNSYALKNDGTVWSWGYNYNGQLGDGTSTERSTPVQVVGVSGAIALAAGSGSVGNYAYALKTDGTVWGWGRGYAVSGVAGDLTKAVLLPGVTNITSLAAGGSSYGLMLKTDGSVGVWNGSSLTTVSGLSNIQAIAGGNSNNYAIASDGGIWNWTTGTPVKVGGISDVSAVAVGGNYVVATKTDGSVWAWGSVNTAGQLGDGTTVAHTVPALVKENTAPQVTLTYPLGTKEAPEASNVSQPVIRWSQSDVALTNFAAYQVQVLDASGAVVVDSGEMKQQWMIDGVNTWTVNKTLPVGQAFQVRVKVYDEQLWSEWSAMGWLKVKDSAELKQSTLSTSASHTLQLKADGSVRAWGSNSSGQLGDGTRQNSKTTAVSVLGLSNVISVAAGAEHSLGLKSDGTVWSWGYNRYGQLGNGNSGNNSDSVVPVQVKTLTGIIAIAAIGNNSYALKNDGTVWSWGYNYNGQLGDGTSTERSTPVQVVGVSGAIALAAGSGSVGNYAYALKTDGTVWGWGRGYAVSGVAGDLTKAVLLPGVTNITSLAAGGSSYGLMLKTDGSVGVWNGSSLTTVSGLSNIQAIAGGNSNNYAIASDGGIWNWTTGTPVKVGGISDVSAVAVGGNYVVATKTDGSVWAWGSVNTAGQLGDGTTVAHTVPALVKENTAPQVTLTYPLGTKEVPEASNVSQPVIRWSQSDAALTNFAAYQVQVLDASGAVVVDSGEMKQQWMIDGVNTWTVNKALPVGQAFQVRVKVYDEQLWSEWSGIGWIKYNKQQISMYRDYLRIPSGQETTVTLTVYGTDGLVNTDFNGLQKVTITGYQTTSEGISGQFGKKELVNSGTTVVDIYFHQGIAEIPLSLNQIGHHALSFLLDDVEIGILDIEIISSKEENSEYGNNLRISSGEETTVTLAVYGTNGLVNTDFNGLQKVTITGYQTTSEGISGQFGKKELVNSGTTVADIYFHQGIAEISLSLNQIGHHTLSFLLDDVEIGNLDIEIISSKEEYELKFAELPTLINSKGEFDLSSIIVFTNKSGNLLGVSKSKRGTWATNKDHYK